MFQMETRSNLSKGSPHVFDFTVSGSKQVPGSKQRLARYVGGWLRIPIFPGMDNKLWTMKQGRAQAKDTQSKAPYSARQYCLALENKL